MNNPIPAPDRLDLFEIYRWILAIMGVSYYLVTTAHSLTQYIANLYQLGPHGTLIRRYLLVQALRFRFRKFARDLIQIAFLATLLMYLVWLHGSWRVFER